MTASDATQKELKEGLRCLREDPGQVLLDATQKELKELVGSYNYISFYKDATQKELKVWTRDTAPGPGRPRCNSERIESDTEYVTNSLSLGLMQLRKN